MCPNLFYLDKIFLLGKRNLFWRNYDEGFKQKTEELAKSNDKYTNNPRIAEGKMPVKHLSLIRGVG